MIFQEEKESGLVINILVSVILGEHDNETYGLCIYHNFYYFCPCNDVYTIFRSKGLFFKNYNINPIQKVSLAFQATGLLGIGYCLLAEKQPALELPDIGILSMWIVFTSIAYIIGMYKCNKAVAITDNSQMRRWALGVQALGPIAIAAVIVVVILVLLLFMNTDKKKEEKGESREEKSKEN